ncbi:hypothetical protein [Amycolatopsis sp. cg9]|uniref:hypothetical protein n=1 Tax=Amycolatopsis sp. cg9 TaxID=3238801 RepID=UPI003523C0F7
MADEPSAEGGSRSYADQVVVSVRIADAAPIDEQVLEVVEIESHGAAWHRDWLVAEIEAIPNADDKEGFPAPYTIEVQENRHEWGASAAVLAITSFIGGAVAGGVIGNGAYDSLKLVGRKMADRLRISGLVPVPPMNEGDALERSQALLAARFGEPVEGLKLVSVEVRPPHAASVTYRGSRDRVYDCDLNIEDGLVIFSRVRRRQE